jgi:hypothetical protein
LKWHFLNEKTKHLEESRIVIKNLNDTLQIVNHCYYIAKLFVKIVEMIKMKKYSHSIKVWQILPLSLFFWKFSCLEWKYEFQIVWESVDSWRTWKTASALHQTTRIWTFVGCVVFFITKLKRRVISFPFITKKHWYLIEWIWNEVLFDHIFFINEVRRVDLMKEIVRKKSLQDLNEWFTM